MLEEQDGVGKRALEHALRDGALKVPRLDVRDAVDPEKVSLARHALSVAP
jgi:hypothetical protein